MVNNWHADAVEPDEVEIRLGEDGLTLEARSPDGWWHCQAAIRVDSNNRLFLGDLSIKPWPGSGTDPRPMSTDALRGLPLGRWLAVAHGQLSSEDRWSNTFESTATGRASARRTASAYREVKLERGPRGFPAEHYRRIARAYLKLQEQGVSRGIIRQLAEQEGRPWQTIRDWVHRATELEFLSAGVPGRAGRTAGPKL